MDFDDILPPASEHLGRASDPALPGRRPLLRRRPLSGSRPPRRRAVRVPASPTRPRSVSRRAFVAGSAASVALAATAAEWIVSSGPKPTRKAAADQPGGVNYSDASLVVCTLYGGNDGLNTVIPYADSAYAVARGTIAIPADQVIQLDSHFGLHPSLSGFKQLWDAGKLAIVQGVGYPDPQLSHFRSMDIWQSAVPDTDVSTGWVGRWMDATGADPLKAIAVGDLLPMVLTGERALGAAVPTGPMTLPGGATAQADFTTLCSPTSSEPPILAAIAQSGSDLLRVQATVSNAISQSDPYLTTTTAAASSSGSVGSGSSASGAQSSGSSMAGQKSGGDLGAQLDVVNRLITGGVPAKVYAVSQQTYDTHADEVATQARLLGELDVAVTNFVNEMSADPKGQHCVVLIYSEFGRRVQANASGGTDHGAASVVFVAGPRVKGGYYGEYPSLSKLDENGNLVYNTDFRSVYATLLANVIGEDPKVVLNGSFPQLGFV